MHTRAVRSTVLSLALVALHGCTLNVTVVMPPMYSSANAPARPRAQSSPQAQPGVRETCAGVEWFSDGTTGRTWEQARAACQRMGGELASVHSSEEQACVTGVLQRAAAPGVGAWMGLSEAQQEGAWRWSDGSSSQYSQWLQGEPNNDSGGPTDCGHLWRDQQWQWNDIPCTRTDPTFVCRL